MLAGSVVMVMGLMCKTCYDGDTCRCFAEDCPFYSPLGDEAEDAALHTLVEEGRSDYYNEWHEYVTDYE